MKLDYNNISVDTDSPQYHHAINYISRVTGLPAPVHEAEIVGYPGGAYIQHLLIWAGNVALSAAGCYAIPESAVLTLTQTLHLGISDPPPERFKRYAPPEAPPPPPKLVFGPLVPEQGYMVGAADTMPDGSVVAGPDGKQYRKEARFFFMRYWRI